jgi:hypothetical protein
MTDRHPGEDSQDRTDRQDNQNITAWTGEKGQDNCGTRILTQAAGTGLDNHGRKEYNRTVRRKERTKRPGQKGQDKKARTTVTGQPGQDSCEVSFFRFYACQYYRMGKQAFKGTVQRDLRGQKKYYQSKDIYMGWG